MSVEPRSKSSEISRRFTVKDGRIVVLRRIRWNDLVELMNSLIEENAYIILNTKATRDGEADWLGRYLAEKEKGKRIGMVA